MIASAIFPVFYFLFLKLNLFPALHLCSVLPFLLGSFCRLSVVRLRCWSKIRGIIFEAIISPSERNQNVQDNPEYNSVLPFRIILKIFAVNMLLKHLWWSFLRKQLKASNYFSKSVSSHIFDRVLNTPLSYYDRIFYYIADDNTALTRSEIHVKY